jgi:hypothetical protein
MQKITASEANAWLDKRPLTRDDPLTPSWLVQDPAKITPMVPAVMRALQIRAQRKPAINDDMWWLVQTPILATAAAITTREVLALTGRDLGYCGFVDHCSLDWDGEFPVAGVLYYQGQLLKGREAERDGREEAGFSVLMRYPSDGPTRTRLLVIHVSRAGVNFGYQIEDDLAQLMHDSEQRPSLPGWHGLRNTDMQKMAGKVSERVHDLARHLQRPL